MGKGITEHQDSIAVGEIIGDLKVFMVRKTLTVHNAWAVLPFPLRASFRDEVVVITTARFVAIEVILRRVIVFWLSTPEIC